MSPLDAFVGLPLTIPATRTRLPSVDSPSVEASMSRGAGSGPEPTTRNPDDDGRISSWP